MKNFYCIVVFLIFAILFCDISFVNGDLQNNPFNEYRRDIVPPAAEKLKLYSQPVDIQFMGAVFSLYDTMQPTPINQLSTAVVGPYDAPVYEPVNFGIKVSTSEFYTEQITYNGFSNSTDSFNFLPTGLPSPSPQWQCYRSKNFKFSDENNGWTTMKRNGNMKLHSLIGTKALIDQLAGKLRLTRKISIAEALAYDEEIAYKYNGMFTEVSTPGNANSGCQNQWTTVTLATIGYAKTVWGIDIPVEIDSTSFYPQLVIAGLSNRNQFQASFILDTWDQVDETFMARGRALANQYCQVGQVLDWCDFFDSSSLIGKKRSNQDKLKTFFLLSAMKAF